MNSVQKGFTLIEIMIVVAIIGVFAVTALPFYQDYTRRARVSEGMILASGVKTAVSEYYSAMNVFPANNISAGLATPANINGAAVNSIDVNANIVTIHFNSLVSTGATTLLLTASSNSGGLSWSCQSPSSTLDSRLRPVNCR